MAEYLLIGKLWLPATSRTWPSTRVLAYLFAIGKGRSSDISSTLMDSDTSYRLVVLWLIYFLCKKPARYGVCVIPGERPRRPIQREFQGLTCMAGMRFEFCGVAC